MMHLVALILLVAALLFVLMVFQHLIVVFNGISFKDCNSAKINESFLLNYRTLYLRQPYVVCASPTLFHIPLPQIPSTMGGKNPAHHCDVCFSS